MNYRLLLLMLLVLGINQLASAQTISGKITDEQGEPLPFLTVFVKGTSNGTTTNSEGNYFLTLKKGDYTLVFRYIGFKTIEREVSVSNKDLLLDITMQEESVTLDAVSIRADSEDPAYEIIRKAQDKRKFYLEQIETYQCNVYIKGLQRITEAPKKILGIDMTIPGAEEDSVNSGIIYFSESVSEYAFQQPDQKKEIMISSKTSGRNNAFSWNSALDFDLNFYRTNIDVSPLSERNFISPIAPTALLYYDYEFKGDFTENGIVVNKIAVKPKREGIPAFSGFVYIQEDSWRIHSTELYITQKLNNVEYVDSLKVKQVYLPVAENIWVIGTQTFEYKFELNLFKIKGDGYYLGIFSNYNLQPNLPPKYFGAEISRVEEDANKKDSTYWDEIRPVKLTEVEITDYQFKDSIEVIRKSKPYLDSVDHVRNKPKPIMLLTGYTYRNSFKNIQFSIPSVLENIQFNTVEGYNLNAALKASRFNREENKYISFEQAFRYGFSSEKLYYKSTFYRRFNGFNRRRLQVEAGHYISQFNDNRPISPFINTLYSLFRERNYMKIYQRSYASIGYGQELVNGIYLTSGIEFSERTPLVNQTDESLIDVEERTFESNHPTEPQNFQPAFEQHRAFLASVGLQIRFKQKYYTRPKFKFVTENKYPTLFLFYQKGIKGVANSITDFDYLKASIFDDLKIGLLGNSQFNVSYGTFLSDGFIPFIDYKHFLTTQTVFSNNTLLSFFNLPYYQFSTSNNFLEAHYEHNFAGFFFQKIPFIRKLKWQVIAGTHYLRIENSPQYFEFTTGIGNVFKVARVDWVFSKAEQKSATHHIRMRIGF